MEIYTSTSSNCYLFILYCYFILLCNDQMNFILAEKYEKKILELNNDKKEQKKQIENLKITVEAAARLESEYDKVEEDNKELKKDVVVSNWDRILESAKSSFTELYSNEQG